MRYVFTQWDALSARMRASKRRIYLFDLDGTLAAIARTPDQARVPKPIQRALARLAKRPGSAVGIVSGRSLENVKKLLPIPEIGKSGNHGLEIEGWGTRFVHPFAKKIKSRIGFLSRALGKRFRRIPGALVENKGYSLSLHYRQVPGRHRKPFMALFDDFAALLRGRFPVEIRKGKKVFEIRPAVRWDKGSAVKFLRRRLSPLAMVIFVGDDLTDEDVFRTLRPKDIGIRVGKTGASAASYYLKDHRDVGRFLEKLRHL